MIETSGLHKAFGAVRAVDGADLQVQAGTTAALLGPSGCGKTTMLRLLAGFERPDAGSVTVGGRLVAGPGTFMAPELRRVGMVFQDYALFPHLDVGGNVGYGLPRARRRNGRVGEMLELVGLEGLESRRPHELSGGQQQRVAIARALAGEPDVVLLDEPFSNLDASLRAQVRGEVRAILRQAGVTALFVTHDQEEALSLADVVAVMRAGRIEQVGTPDEVYERPATRWVAEFLGEADVFAARTGEGFVECELGRFPVEAGFAGPAEVVVRPESISLSLRPDAGGRPSHHARVVRREFFGHDQLVVVELESGLRLRSRCLSFPAWHPGDRVHAALTGPVNVVEAASGRS
jgi:iron(III) transport system ATP-binding protein